MVQFTPCSIIEVLNVPCSMTLPAAVPYRLREHFPLPHTNMPNHKYPQQDSHDDPAVLLWQYASDNCLTFPPLWQALAAYLPVLKHTEDQTTPAAPESHLF